MRAIHVVLASLCASATLTTAAFAQDYEIPRDGLRDYQLQRWPSRPRDQRFPARDDVAIDTSRSGPRFIVEAVSFKAVNESGWDVPYTSDEVFAYFWTQGASMVTSNFEQVDTGDTRRFPSHQNCIWPAVDTDGRANGRWACDPEGREGPIEFSVHLLDDDIIGLPTGFAVCARQDGPGDLAQCPELVWNDRLLRGEFRFEVDQIVPRLGRECNCWTQTARQSVDDETTYEFTFRITMVSLGTGLEVLDPGANETGVTPPTVHSSGTLTASLNQHFEFDAGTVVGSGGDIIFMRRTDNNALILQPTGGARILMGNVNPRGYAGCVANAASHVSARIAVPDVGSHACFITSEGRVGEVRIVELTNPPFGGVPTLTLSYTTWQ